MQIGLCGLFQGGGVFLQVIISIELCLETNPNPKQTMAVIIYDSDTHTFQLLYQYCTRKLHTDITNMRLFIINSSQASQGSQLVLIASAHHKAGTHDTDAI